MHILAVIGAIISWVVPFLVVVTVVITIHEFGHFLMARLFGVKVDRFSIGFGKTIIARTDRSGVEWRLAWLPFGGYVRFAGDANVAGVPDQGDLEDLKQAIVKAEGAGAERRYYHFKPVWQRALIALAGPLANAVLAVVAFSLLFGIFGYPDGIAKIGKVEPGSPAARAGFQVGDVVLAADGHRVESFDSLRNYLSTRPGERISFQVRRQDRTLDLEASAGTAYEVHIGAGGGLKKDDVVVGADGRDLGEIGPLPGYIDRLKPKPVILDVERAAAKGPAHVSLQVGPENRQAVTHALRLAAKRGMLGVTPDEKAARQYVQPTPWQAVRHGGEYTVFVVGSTVHYVQRLFTGHESGDQLSGPLGMIQATGSLTREAAEVHGPIQFRVASVGFTMLQLIAIISIGIGILNLLPIPILDGGHLLFYAYEAVARKPLGARIQELGYQVGLALLLGLMLFATWNDLQKQSVFEKILGGLFS